MTDPVFETQESYQPGDLLVGGIASQFVFFSQEFSFTQYPSEEFSDYIIVMTKFYQHILSLAFAVKQINEDPNILPNATLGFHIYDSYNDVQMIYRSSLYLLFRSHKFVPNYLCGVHKNIIAVIAALSPKTSFLMAQILSITKIPQLHPFLQHVSFNNSAGERVSFNDKREMVSGFDIMNIAVFPNMSIHKVKVGRVNPDDGLEGNIFTINDSMITWDKSFTQVRTVEHTW
nr:vomeronasal type-2 receptor 26-like [Pogona vitticeps]